MIPFVVSQTAVTHPLPQSTRVELLRPRNCRAAQKVTADSRALQFESTLAVKL